MLPDISFLHKNQKSDLIVACFHHKAIKTKTMMNKSIN